MFLCTEISNKENAQNSFHHTEIRDAYIYHTLWHQRAERFKTFYLGSQLNSRKILRTWIHTVYVG